MGGADIGELLKIHHGDTEITEKEHGESTESKEKERRSHGISSVLFSVNSSVHSVSPWWVFND